MHTNEGGGGTNGWNKGKEGRSQDEGVMQFLPTQLKNLAESISQ